MDIFPKSVESKLGFDVLRERLNGLTLSDMGRDRLAGMRLSRDREWIQAELERVSELQQAFRFDDPLPLHRIMDVRGVVRRAAPEGAIVGPEDLANLRQVLVTARRLHDYFKTRREKYVRLHDVASQITPLPDLEDRIDGVVDADGRIRDDASSELRRLRRLIVQRQAALRETLQKALRKAMSGGYATEDQPTIRNGRMVIPVRAEAKRKIEGFVQDTSASGQTVYIEPTACLDLNNEVRELEGEERREVERILREMTAEIRAHLGGLHENVRVLGAFDLLQAKAALSNEIKAAVPKLNEDGHIRIVAGRNPVLLLHVRATYGKAGGELRAPAADEPGIPREVVPLDLSLGRDFRTLIITGPNAGGKTVAMKTVGVFALMTAYGLPLPVDERSEFSVFDELLVDLGDEQSIEEDLSTFSSHISNLKRMLRKAGDRTLVLIDEAGTGTDPAEGGALAQAVLEKLTQLGARTIATTHHGTLKVFAHESAGVENGSMEFDQETLSPTYRFQPGVPGSSYAFEIASRIGLDDDVLESARKLVGEQKTALEDLITTFESRTQELESKISLADEELRQAKHEREQYRQRADKLRREREDIRRQALEEAERIVSSANARIERTIRQIKEAGAEKEVTREARDELEAFRVEVGERKGEGEGWRREEEVEPVPVPRAEGASAVIEVGDQVVLDDGSTAAEVLELEEGEAVISFESMRLRADVSRLRKIGGKRTQKARVGRVEKSGGEMSLLHAQSRIDLRGRRVDEAIDAVTRMIDEAVAANLNQVEILHGKGTGALRQAIHEYLAQRQDVESFEDAPWNQGGAGVTHVRLG